MATDQATDAPAITTDIRLIAGDCLVELTGDVDATIRGQVVVLVKPDQTVLVHDLDGYQPVAWLTRADAVRYNADQEVLTAVDGDQWLRVGIEHAMIDRRFPGSAAGDPVGSCPSCSNTLVAKREVVTCISCDVRYGLPDGATVTDGTCTCGLPTFTVERGEVFERCIDRECAPLDAAVADRFDGEWDCPNCSGGSLRVIRRNRLLIGCDRYPDCDTAFQFPTGLLDGTCGCGLPRFRDGDRTTCPDGTCDAA